MATAKTTIERATTVASKPVYASIGVTDLAVERMRTVVADFTKRVQEGDFAPQALGKTAVATFSARVDDVREDAKKRQAWVEAQHGGGP